MKLVVLNNGNWEEMLVNVKKYPKKPTTPHPNQKTWKKPKPTQQKPTNQTLPNQTETPHFWKLNSNHSQILSVKAWVFLLGWKNLKIPGIIMVQWIRNQLKSAISRTISTIFCLTQLVVYWRCLKTYFFSKCEVKSDFYRTVFLYILMS